MPHPRLAAAFALTGALLARTDGATAGEPPLPGTVGASVRPFEVRHPDGGKETLPEKFQSANALVVVFVSFDCPVAKSYLAPLGELAKAYRDKGVEVVGVCPEESAADVKARAAEFKLPFPVYADPERKAGRELGVKCVPEAFVLDAKGVICYRGRIDDGWLSPAKQNPRPPVPDLKNALDEVLAGKPVTLAKTAAVGCSVRLAERAKAAPDGAAKVTFYKDVLPVLQNRCQECHRPGEVGPFGLLTYKDAYRWADLIKDYTASRAMPPWKPAGGPAYRNPRAMPAAEIERLAAWVDAGCPEGDPKDGPPEKAFDAARWQLGKPDLILEMPDDVHLGPTGPDHFRAVVLPTGLTEDKMIVAYEVKPGNPRIVHHALNYFDTTGTARKLETEERARKKGPAEADGGPGYPAAMGIGFTPPKAADVGGIGGWTPGLRGFQLPDGTGYFLPKGSDVVVQMHYHRNGKAETDRTKIGLYFATADAPLKPLKLLLVPGLVAPTDGYKPFATIPAGTAEFVVRGRVVAEQDCTIYSVLPHMHMLGKKVKVTMTPPGRPEQLLVDIPDWDYGWQESYFFKRPIAVTAGTRFEVAATFDNSAANPNNPFSPPRPAKRGEQTTDEMLFGIIRATADGPGTVIEVKGLTNPADYAPGK